jgi:hypothetical protein
MQSNSRRQFLLRATASWGSFSLVACGGGQQGGASAGQLTSGQGGGDTSTASAPPAPSPAPAPAPSPPAPPVVAAPNPLWMESQPLNSWFAIPGTVHAGSAAAPAEDPADPYAASNRRLAYSGMALRASEIILAATGGHTDYSGNQVTSIDLSQDAPVWQLRSAASTTTAMDVAYYPDGTPSSRHTYWSTTWSETRNRVMLHYSRFVYGNGVSFVNSNGFDLDTNSWDAQGTWADGFSAGCADANGDCYAMGVGYFSLNKWTAATDTWSTVATFGTAINVNPVCYDLKRGHLFALAWGDGQGNAIGGGDIGISAFKIAGTTKTGITFNPSAALTQFQSDAPAYSGMEYDPVNDQYLFYQGAAGSTSRVYVVKPNDTSVWDMQSLTLGTASAVPPAAVGAGVFNRFRYVEALRGFVLMASGTSELYFLRTA